MDRKLIGVCALTGTIGFLVGTICLTMYIKGKKKKKQDWSTGINVFKKVPRGSTKLELSNIHVITNTDEWDKVSEQLNSAVQQFPVLGMDCEWVPVTKAKDTGSHPVALLQLATQDHLCLLVRLSKMTDIPPTLKALMKNKRILKVGVAVCDDAKKLEVDHKLTTQGCVDLRFVAGRCRVPQASHMGLKTMTEFVLGVHLGKSHIVRCGDWEAESLSTAQMEYAAKDAIVGVQIYRALLHHKLSCVSARRGLVVSQHLNRDDVEMRGTALWQGLVDVTFKRQGKQNGKIQFSEDVNDLVYQGPTSNKPRGTSRKGECKAYVTRKTPLYDNCQLQAPDGTMLCTCDIKKAQWYIDKELGVSVSDEPFIVKLKFEPSGRPRSDRNYYLETKFNICVVCGSNESYIRKHIVPKEYRKHFPTIMKEHKSHDIVLMCTLCHQTSCVYDAEFRDRLAMECDAPLANDAGAKYKNDFDLQKICSAAKALLLNNAKIPEKRRQELQTIITDYYGFGAEFLTEDVLKEAMNIETRSLNSTYVPHGRKVTFHYSQCEGGLVGFEKMWREHFISTMQPQFLPKLWSVTHCHDQLEDMATSFHDMFENNETT